MWSGAVWYHLLWSGCALKCEWIGFGGGRAPFAEAQGNAAQSLAGADSRIGCGAVTDLFTAHCILLVIEL